MHRTPAPRPLLSSPRPTPTHHLVWRTHDVPACNLLIAVTRPCLAAGTTISVIATFIAPAIRRHHVLRHCRHLWRLSRGGSGVGWRRGGRWRRCRMLHGHSHGCRPPRGLQRRREHDEVAQRGVVLARDGARLGRLADLRCVLSRMVAAGRQGEVEAKGGRLRGGGREGCVGQCTGSDDDDHAAGICIGRGGCGLRAGRSWALDVGGGSRKGATREEEEDGFHERGRGGGRGGARGRAGVRVHRVCAPCACE